MSARIAALAAPVLLAPIVAQARPVSRLDVGGGIGWNGVRDSDLDLRDNLARALTSLPSRSRSGSIEAEDGIVGILSLEWGYGNGLRTELEASFRGNSIGSITGLVPGGLGNIGGKWRTSTSA